MCERDDAVLIVTAAVAVGAMLTITPPSAAAQTAETTVSTGSWTPAQTPWGDPDLQGIWNGKTQTPLQRPEEYAAREFLTDDEVADLERANLENPGRDERAEPGTVADVEGAYNNAFSSFFGSTVVGTRRTSLIVDPPDGQIPYTSEARERVAAETAARRAEREKADGPEDRPGDRCMGVTIPCVSALCAYSRIVQTPGAVTLYYEAGHWGGAYRTIALDGRPHLPPTVRQWLGDSRGRWEDTTLVVETANFTDQSTFRGASRDMRLTERFARVAPDTIMYQATVDDPSTFTQPWTLEMTWTKNDDSDNLIFESACHEGNYALTSILAGARAIENASQPGTR